MYKEKIQNNTLFREARIEDLDILVSLHTKLLMMEGDFIYDKVAISNGMKMLLANVNSFILVLETKGEIIGMCTLQFVVSTVEGGMVAVVEDVIIDEKYRRRGLGKKFFRYIEDFCKLKNIRRIQLLTQYENKNSIMFYKSLGLNALERIFFFKKL